jgi:hypothetical protein
VVTVMAVTIIVKMASKNNFYEIIKTAKTDFGGSA